MNGDDPLWDLDEPLPEDRQDRPRGSSGTGGSGPESPSAHAPSTEIPSTDPERLSDRYGDVDPAFRALFWKLIVLYKFGLIGLTLGLVLLALGVDPRWGLAVTVGGGALLARALVLTRRGRHRLEAGAFEFDRSTDERERAGSADRGDTE